jgi:hypothetical protein
MNTGNKEEHNYYEEYKHRLEGGLTGALMGGFGKNELKYLTKYVFENEKVIDVIPGQLIGDFSIGRIVVNSMLGLLPLGFVKDRHPGLLVLTDKRVVFIYGDTVSQIALKSIEKINEKNSLGFKKIEIWSGDSKVEIDMLNDKNLFEWMKNFNRVSLNL